MSQANMWPSDDGGNGGRGVDGKFAPGNRFGQGRPPGRTAELRDAMRDAVSLDDIQAIVRVLVAQARGGDVQAAREVLDRCCGRTPLAMPEGALLTPETPIRFILGTDGSGV